LLPFWETGSLGQPILPAGSTQRAKNQEQQINRQHQRLSGYRVQPADPDFQVREEQQADATATATEQLAKQQAEAAQGAPLAHFMSGKYIVDSTLSLADQIRRHGWPEPSRMQQHHEQQRRHKRINTSNSITASDTVTAETATVLSATAHTEVYAVFHMNILGHPAVNWENR
jgi:hypothetical protein